MLVCHICGSDMVYCEGRFDPNTNYVLGTERSFCEDCGDVETLLVTEVEFELIKEEYIDGGLRSK